MALAITNTDAGPISNITHDPFTRGNIIAPLIINPLNINVGTSPFMTATAMSLTAEESVASYYLARQKEKPINEVRKKQMNKSNFERNKLIRPLMLALGLITILALSGCATPLGQRYGTIGALGGAVIGGAADGLPGAVIGGAAGAAAGGYIGDQESFDQERQYQNRQQQNYQQECWYESIYDYDGYEVGRQRFCR
jgi:hypothetical protein